MIHIEWSIGRKMNTILKQGGISCTGVRSKLNMSGGWEGWVTYSEIKRQASGSCVCVCGGGGGQSRHSVHVSLLWTDTQADTHD